MESSFTIIYPFDGSIVATFDYTTKKQVDEMLFSLIRGKNTQKELSYFERANILEKLAQLLHENSEKLAQLITQEVGKTITDSRVELERSRSTVICTASEVRNIKGEVLSSDAYPPKRDRMGIVQLHPLGVVLAITPFNFPINIAMHKIAPAFAAGNTILFKPSPQNYLSAKLVTELCYEAGIPEDVLQMCVPDIPVMSQLASDDRIQCINFTGGTSAAKKISEQAGFKKLLFELGGNDPLIVMDDADLELATETTIQQRFGTTGQRCTACKRVFVHESVYSSFREKLLEKTKNLQVGDPKKETTFTGPLVHEKATEEVFGRIKEAISSGAKVLCGNKREGNIIYPTILENVATDCTLVAEETFGPVVPLFSFSNIDEIIPIINASKYGLQSGVFTQNMSVIKKLYRCLEVGALAVNDGPGFRAEHFPFGGVKDSGIGREGIYYAIREMSFQKTLIL